MEIQHVLKHVRGGTMKTEEATQKILEIMKKDKKEMIQNIRQSLKEEGLLKTPSNLIQQLLKSPQSSSLKLIDMILNQASTILTVGHKRIGQPFLNWLQKVTPKVPSTTKDQTQEVHLHLSLLRHCDYEETSQLNHNDLFMSRWADLHCTENTICEHNLFQASQLARIEIQNNVWSYNHFVLSFLLKSYFDNNHLEDNTFYLSLIHKNEVTHTKLNNSQINSSILYQVLLSENHFDSIRLQNSQIRLSHISQCTLKYVYFEKCTFHKCLLSNIQLEGTEEEPIVIQNLELYNLTIQNCSKIEDFMKQIQQLQEKESSIKESATTMAHSTIEKGHSTGVQNRRSTKNSESPKRRTTEKKTTATRKSTKSSKNQI